MAADQFMSLVVDRSLRLANLGIKHSPRVIEQWVRSSVDLFLSGARRHDGFETSGDPSRKRRTVGKVRVGKTEKTSKL
jgi:hypothetical protein